MMATHVTVTAQAAHRCPFRDEVDYGTVTIEWDADAAHIELHALRESIDSFYDRKITHEDFTESLHSMWPETTVTTRWTTAGMEVECVVPRDESV